MTPRRFLSIFFAMGFFLASAAVVVRAADEFVQGEDASSEPKVVKKKAVKKKKKGYDYDRSKYKSRVPSQTKSYKFNSRGEPIKAKGKRAPVKKKRPEPPEKWIQGSADTCGFSETCAEKKTEADSL
ncbi:MAG: hypothetical protein COV48_17190 [Elusimicrobia bacterium CG11_big_fil_rev_8_21_14_0_20_64_6]|nr:MAG: hypothetical protein COV48_17190 [Elusimicrobia bacterium CG11_big_fil_rev_8_21_14_0_20_64_6]